MFLNYLKSTLRNIQRYPMYSCINLAGLVLGISTSLLIFIWVFNELSYDRFHEHSSNIVRVIEKRHFPESIQYSSRTPGLLASFLKDGYQEIKDVTRHAWTGERIIKREGVKHYEKWIVCVDPSFLNIFSFPFIHGDKKSALTDLYSIVITEKIAEKYFGAEDPIGKTLTMDNRFDLTVTGVIADIPSNSHFRFNMVVPFEIVEKLGWNAKTWKFSLTSTYLHLDEKTDVSRFEEKISGFIKNHDADTNIELSLQPLHKIHLYSNFYNPNSPGKIQYVWIFAVIGILILLMACINYMNLATARSEVRIKEVGIRKVLGANRRNLLFQFQLEAIFLVFIAVLISPVVLSMFIPQFNKITGEIFSFNDFFNWKILLMVLGVSLFTGFVSGSYPSIFLASFHPTKVFKAGDEKGTRSAFLRKSLVFIQITISLMLIIVSIVFIKQIDFMKNKELGFNKEHVISIPLGIGNRDNAKIYNVFRNKTIQYPNVQNVTGAWTHPFQFGTPADSILFKGNRIDENVPVTVTSVDYDYIETFKIQMLEGRSYNRERGNERGNWIINEQFAELMGVKSPLDQPLKIGNSRGQIIGLMKDFHIEPVTDALIGPMLLFYHPNVNNIFVRIDPADISSTLKFLEQGWNKINPAAPFNFRFLDEEFNELFQDIDNIAKAVEYFTIFSIFIACLGLFGLSSFSTERRRKEIGIRKILGSSEMNIIYLLCGDYIKLVGISIVFSCPAAYLIIRSWLINFPYRINVHWTIMFFSCLMILGIIVLTVGLHAFRAARANPVDCLRYE